MKDQFRGKLTLAIYQELAAQQPDQFAVHRDIAADTAATLRQLHTRHTPR
jgi:hypothetical protein